MFTVSDTPRSKLPKSTLMHATDWKSQYWNNSFYREFVSFTEVSHILSYDHLIVTDATHDAMIRYFFFKW